MSYQEQSSSVFSFLIHFFRINTPSVALVPLVITIQLFHLVTSEHIILRRQVCIIPVGVSASKPDMEVVRLCTEIGSLDTHPVYNAHPV